MSDTKTKRERTAYQVKVLEEIKAFCPPVDRTSLKVKFTKVIRPHAHYKTLLQETKKVVHEQVVDKLMRPSETMLTESGSVLVVWREKTTVRSGGVRVSVKCPYFEKDDKGKEHTARNEIAAFGVFLDWCDDNDLKYGYSTTAKLPNAKFVKTAYGWNYISDSMIFVVRIPREPK